MSRQGSVKRDDSGRWCFVVDVPGPDGRRRQLRRRGFRTKGNANDALTELLGELRSGATPGPARLTVGAFLRDRWLPAIETTLAPNTVASYRQMTTRHLIPRLGGIELAHLSGDALSKAYAGMATGGRLNGKGGLSSRTVRLAHVTMHRALKDAVRWGLVIRNAADAADPPRLGHREAAVWTPDQVGIFLEAVTGDRWHVAYLLAATTGLRRGELAGLRWPDVDIGGGRLSVRQAVAVVSGQMVTGAPKTARSRRQVALDPRTVEVLRAWRRRQLEERIVIGTGWQNHDDRVLTWADGRPVNPDVLTKSFERLVVATGLPRLTLHGLRHSHATAALLGGIDLKVIADRLGHSSITITADTYAHVVEGLDQAAATKIGDLMLGKCQVPVPG